MRLVASLFLLSLMAEGCATHVSTTELLPLPDVIESGKPRIDPLIKEFPLATTWKVQDTCAKIVGSGNGIIATALLLWFRACAHVPLDPSNPCVVVYKLGDEERRQHELKHCEGWADTW